MEDNNNSFLIKAMAGALILILALNVIRTESTKKQMDRLAAAFRNRCSICPSISTRSSSTAP